MFKLLKIFLFSTLFLSPLLVRAFTDVPEDHDFFLDIKYLSEKGVIQGYADGSFHPDLSIPRVEALGMIFKAKGEFVGAFDVAGFKDVDDAEWFYPLVNYATSQGVVNGDPDGNFRPRGTINTAEGLKMIINTFYDEFDAPDYMDQPLLEMKEGDWFSDYLLFAQQKGLINKNKYYHPAKLLTRAEMASMIHRMMLMEAGDIATIQEFDQKSNSEYQLFIPKLGIVDVPIIYVEDFTDYDRALDVLWDGVGNFRYQPGTLGKIVIYGHSSYLKGLDMMYKHVFRYLDDLDVGDRIYINYKNKGFIYEVFDEEIVKPENIDLLKSDGEEKLVLFTCWPRDSFSQRYVIHAKRIETD